MERKLYLEACERFAASGDKFVVYGSATYAPIAYQLSFAANHQVRHTAVLKDIRSSALVYCRLDEVK